MLLGRRTGGGDRRFRRERCGRGWDRPRPGSVWIHCASVGEVMTACPLIHVLAGRCARPLLLTTNTPTGASTARRVLPESVAHAYLPVDSQPAVSAFLEAFRPAGLLVCETELWPELYHQCHARGIPVVLFNARLTSRTLRSPGWLRRLYGDILAPVRTVLARSEADGARFQALGARRVEVLGNLKWAACDPGGEPARPLGEAYWAAVSTHEGEELALARIQATLPAGSPRLVLIPRHPERGAPIARKLRAAGIEVSRRAAGEPPHTPVVLADTLGEAVAFMAHAELVFMGGSLVPAGGHNLLEPARLGKAVVVGPHMDDFAEETAALLDAGAVRQVGDCREAGVVIRGLLADVDERERMGEAARRLVAGRGREVVGRYAEAVAIHAPGLFRTA